MSEHYITLAEVNKFLSAEHEKRELLVTQKAAMEHAKNISTLTAEKSRELVAEVSQIPDISDSIAVKIADFLPQYPEDIRAILSKERVTIDAATTDSIIEIVAKYL